MKQKKPKKVKAVRFYYANGSSELVKGKEAQRIFNKWAYISIPTMRPAEWPPKRVKVEPEIRALLSKLHKWKKRQDSKKLPKRELWFEDKKLGLKILEDYSHSGVSEWISALRWMLGEKGGED